MEFMKIISAHIHFVRFHCCFDTQFEELNCLNYLYYQIEISFLITNLFA